MKNMIRSCFGKAAGSYYDSASVQKEVAAICAANCPEGQYGNVLDIGSGVGFLSGSLEEHCNFSNYYSLDLTLPMLVEQRSHYSSPILVAADGEALPFKRETFDLLVSSSAMQWFMSPEDSIPEIFTLLKRGGSFSFSIFVHGTLKELEDVSSRTGFGRMHNLKSESYYINIFEKIRGLEFSCDQREFVTFHPNVREFLKKHKMTGAGASGKKMSFGKKSYSKFVEEYERLYSVEGKVMSTFRSLFIYGRKMDI